VIFSAQPITKPDEALADPELIARVDVGEISSFMVDRQPAGKNATCAKLSRPTLYEGGTKIAQDPALGGKCAGDDQVRTVIYVPRSDGRH